jgi:hypothetical protein
MHVSHGRVTGKPSEQRTEPGEEHWHGAGGDTLMTHTAVSHGATRWGAEVAEADYSAASAGQAATRTAAAGAGQE